MTRQELTMEAAKLRLRIRMNSRLKLESQALLSRLLREYEVPVPDELLASLVLAVPDELRAQSHGGNGSREAQNPGPNPTLLPPHREGGGNPPPKPPTDDDDDDDDDLNPPSNPPVRDDDDDDDNLNPPSNPPVRDDDDDEDLNPPSRPSSTQRDYGGGDECLNPPAKPPAGPNLRKAVVKTKTAQGKGAAQTRRKRR
jgi:hypothetical protein